MAEENRRLTGTLFLESISLTLRLGALPFERIESRRVRLDLKWTGKLLSDGRPVVDYSQVCTSLKNKLEPEYEYIEQLAGDVLVILQNNWPGKWSVSVHKDHPPTDFPMERATVTIGK
ncbi:MAG: dihydroneopterin aldolase [Candidatus Sabulitectum sp.]|nr:dihydroneopterin aldolase [Candidatus Sabulitectum sp.]